MGVVVYMDEAGDHSLELIDRDFPIFCLSLFVCEENAYTDSIVPSVLRLKFKWFRHEGVVLHSRDIRKAQNDFSLLTDKAKWNEFLEDINGVMRDSEYSLIAIVIRKQKHRNRYGMAADNPYDLAVKFALERLLPLLEAAGQTEAQIIAEGRGKREDEELHSSFLKIVNYGTEYVSRDRFRKMHFALEFRRKEANIIGTQLADLAAYPTARHVLNPSNANPAFDILRGKFYRGPGRIRGLKVFPE